MTRHNVIYVKAFFSRWRLNQVPIVSIEQLYKVTYSSNFPFFTSPLDQADHSPVNSFRSRESLRDSWPCWFGKTHA